MELEALVARRRQLIDMLVAERNRERLARPSTKRQLAEHVEWLEQRSRLWTTPPGPGNQAEPGLAQQDTCCSRFQAWDPSYLARCWPCCPSLEHSIANKPQPWWVVAPFDRDSGTLRGKRTISGGRAAVRAVLYIGGARRMSINLGHSRDVPTAAKRREACEDRSHRLCSKLLTIMNAMIRNKQRWAA